MTPRPPGVLVYDGDCGFCERSVARIRSVTRATAPASASHDVDLAALGLTDHECAQAVQWVVPSGSTSGAEALRDFAATGTRWAAVLGRLIVNRVTRPVTGSVYAVVARNRHRLGSPSCGVEPVGSTRHTG